jgi:hypothetical protein
MHAFASLANSVKKVALLEATETITMRGAMMLEPT